MEVAMLTQIEVVEFLIRKGPGRTEAELATAIFGPCGQQPVVNQDCRLLEQRGAVERRGSGGSADPYRYFTI